MIKNVDFSFQTAKVRLFCDLQKFIRNEAFRCRRKWISGKTLGAETKISAQASEMPYNAKHHASGLATKEQECAAWWQLYIPLYERRRRSVVVSQTRSTQKIGANRLKMD